MTTAPPVPPATSDHLRIVLFGRPAAGKSSLLGALGYAAQTQPHLLGGTLEDTSQGLSELAKQVYDYIPDRTPAEVVTYPIRYQPIADGKPAGEVREAVLLDCDGRVANTILLNHQMLDQASPEGTLAHEVGEADTLILLLDSATPGDGLEDEFTEFAHFLEAMQKIRSEQTEVAGLPVFLVLTKCDLLAHPGDNVGKWMERIEQRKRDVDTRFRAFLTGRPAGAILAKPDAVTDTPFGRLELHVWATAIKRPPLLITPGKPREPYGVAELFRQALRTAETFRARWERSERRLTGLVVGASLLVGIMGLLAILFFAFGLSTQLSGLRDSVETFRYLDGNTPGERLKGAPNDLRERERRLLAFESNPQFGRLSADLQGFVTERLEELKAYVPYLEKLMDQPPPANEVTQEGLEKALTKLRDDFALPHDDWADTRAGILRKGRLDSGEALLKAVQAVRNWYLDSSDQAGRLWTFADYPSGEIDWTEWAANVEKLLDTRRRSPFRDNEGVPGATAAGLTFHTVMRFDRVVDARASWATDQAKLQRLLNVSAAIGLVTPTKDRPAVLVFPRDFSLAASQTRLAELKSAYPDYERAFRREGLPEAVLPRLRQVARRQYEQLLEPARAEVLRQLRLAGSGKEETVARWQAMSPWLRQPESLFAWRELARVVVRLVESNANDPVTALQEFVGRKQFTLTITSLTLEIPEVRGLKPRALSRLIVLHPASERQPALAFELSGESTLDAARRVRVYNYKLAEGKALVYRPGDNLWAELSLTEGKERLVWSQARSGLYLFERLRLPPRLQPTTATMLEGRVMEDVHLVLRPEDGVPQVPDLMPWVRFD